MIRAVLLVLIRGYRRLVSPAYGQVCKYHPSCSAYALAAVDTHGALRGTLLAGWRVLRCNPFSHGGYDPVPPAGHWRRAVSGDQGEDESHGHAAMSDDGGGGPPDTGLATVMTTTMLTTAVRTTAGAAGPDLVRPNPSAVHATAAAGEPRP